MSDVITPAELTDIMEGFGNEACLLVQKETHAAWPGGWVPPSIVMSLGLRETNLTNIAGGATLVNGQWQRAYTDRGVFQITDTFAPSAKWLASVPGCPNGPNDVSNWVPDMAGFRAGKTNALTAKHSPTLSAGLGYSVKSMKADRAQAYTAGVKPNDALQFVVAAHNAGFEGALKGYQEGNVDAYTTLGDYSWWVLHNAPMIAAWIIAHPKWRWTP
jgi:hypothetical protein